MRLGWNRDEGGVITVFAHASDGRGAPVADFWVQPLIDKFGMARPAAKEMQEQFAEMLVQHHNRHFRIATPPQSKSQLAEMVARRMLKEMAATGSVETFCENMAGYPVHYLTELAPAAIDCIDLGGRLTPAA